MKNDKTHPEDKKLKALLQEGLDSGLSPKSKDQIFSELREHIDAKINLGLEQVANGETVPADENFVSGFMDEVERRTLPEGFEPADIEQAMKTFDDSRDEVQPVIDYLKDK